MLPNRTLEPPAANVKIVCYLPLTVSIIFMCLLSVGDRPYFDMSITYCFSRSQSIAKRPSVGISSRRQKYNPSFRIQPTLSTILTHSVRAISLYMVTNVSWTRLRHESLTQVVLILGITKQAKNKTDSS